MNLIEAEIILNILLFLYFYLFYCHICCLGSFMEDFLYSVKIRESILMSYFTRHLQRLVKFWHRRKKWKVFMRLTNFFRSATWYVNNTTNSSLDYHATLKASYPGSHLGSYRLTLSRDTKKDQTGCRNSQTRGFDKN